MPFMHIQRWLCRHKDSIYTRLVRSDFGSVGRGSVIHPPFHSNNPSQVYVGDNCQIWSWGWIDCVSEYFGQKFDPRIDIGDGTYIGFRCHIIACGRMSIGAGCVIADGVYISDNLHGFSDFEKPILEQPLSHPGPVTIGDSVWIGEGAKVLPNVTIGSHSVVGAGSVVTKNIPEYSIAVGAPARVIKVYDRDTKTWLPKKEP